MKFLNNTYEDYCKSLTSLDLPYLSRLNLNQVILLSWPFVILNAIYVIACLVISNSGMVSGRTVLLITYWQLGSILTFPFASYLFYLFWKVSLGLYFGALDVDSRKADRIIATSFSSYIVLSIPVIGSFIRSFVQMYLLYKNIKFELNLSRSQTGFVILTPLLIQLFIFFSFVISIYLVVLTLINY